MKTLPRINHLHPSLTAPTFVWEKCDTTDVLKYCGDFKPERFPKPIVEVHLEGIYRQVGVLFTFQEPLKGYYGIRVLKTSSGFDVQPVEMESCVALLPSMSCSALSLEGLLFRVHEALEAFDEKGSGYKNFLHELFGIIDETVDK